ncbi:MAG: HEAT repeat domain-containing protein [Anaerolineales bacterium]|nr:HEAT repeat domain-containing protein [Anaerolineales bacterium]
MSKVDEYRKTLEKLDDWDDYLRAESGLPGPRGNLELAHAAADLADRERFEHFLSFDPQRAPVNTPDGFLAFCGVEGLGRVIVEGQTDLWPTLRAFASDPRWRIREAVAMALQRVGRADMNPLLDNMDTWATGNWLEMRAVAAGLAEPVLLREERHILRALTLLDRITAAIENAEERNEDFKILRQGLGYCWSVVVAAQPAQGKGAMERWFSSTDKDVRWIMKENLKKKRLERMDKDWVNLWKSKMS